MKKLFVVLLPAILASCVAQHKVDKEPATKQNNFAQTMVDLQKKSGTSDFNTNFKALKLAADEYQKSDDYKNAKDGEEVKQVVDQISLLTEEDVKTAIETKSFSTMIDRVENQLPEVQAKADAIADVIEKEAGGESGGTGKTEEKPKRDYSKAEPAVGFFLLGVGALATASTLAMMTVQARIALPQEAAHPPTRQIMQHVRANAFSTARTRFIFGSLPPLIIGALLIAQDPPDQGTILAAKTLLGIYAGSLIITALAFGGLAIGSNLFIREIERAHAIDQENMDRLRPAGDAAIQAAAVESTPAERAIRVVADLAVNDVADRYTAVEIQEKSERGEMLLEDRNNPNSAKVFDNIAEQRRFAADIDYLANNVYRLEGEDVKLVDFDEANKYKTGALMGFSQMINNQVINEGVQRGAQQLGARNAGGVRNQLANLPEAQRRQMAGIARKVRNGFIASSAVASVVAAGLIASAVSISADQNQLQLANSDSPLQKLVAKVALTVVGFARLEKKKA